MRITVYKTFSYLTNSYEVHSVGQVLLESIERCQENGDVVLGEKCFQIIN